MTRSKERNPAVVVRPTVVLLALAFCAAISGCAHPPVDNDLFENNGPSEVGATSFAVTSVTPWEDIESELQPSFFLSEDEALAKVMPVVGYGAQSDTESTRLALNLGVSGLPLRQNGGGGKSSGYTNPGENTGKGNGNSHNNGGSSGGKQNGGGNGGGSKKQQSNAGGGHQGNNADDSSAGDQSDTSDDSPGFNHNNSRGQTGSDAGGANSVVVTNIAEGGPIGLEPQLQYNLATSLLQYVRMTNHYVHDLVNKEGAHAYVVRMQITLMPLSREAQYDTYTDISFFTQDAAGNIIPVKAVPLLSTDSLEGLMQTNTSSNLRDLALSLQATYATASGGVDLEKLTQKLETMAGENKNSLLTLGRVTDNTVRVRLGAMAQPTGDYVMVPRTCTVPVVLLVEGQMPTTSCMAVHAATKTVFVNSKSGKLLRGRESWRTLADLPPIRNSYRLLNPNNPYTKSLDELHALAAAGDASGFCTAIRSLPGDANLKSLASISELWLEAVSLCSTDAIQMLDFKLPSLKLPRLPPADQTATLYDDGTVCNVYLHGGAMLDQLDFEGVLEVKNAAGAPMHLYAASGPAISPSSRDIEFTFPSLTALGIVEPVGLLDPKQVSLIVTSSSPQNQNSAEKPTQTPYNIVLSKNPEPPPSPAAPLASASPLELLINGNEIEVGDTNQVDVPLKITPLSGTTVPYHLTVVGGAVITKIAGVGNAPAETILDKDNHGCTIKGGGQFTLTLAQCTQPEVEFSIFDSAGKACGPSIRRSFKRGSTGEKAGPTNAPKPPAKSRGGAGG